MVKNNFVAEVTLKDTGLSYYQNSTKDNIKMQQLIMTIWIKVTTAILTWGTAGEKGLLSLVSFRTLQLVGLNQCDYVVILNYAFE